MEKKKLNTKKKKQELILNIERSNYLKLGDIEISSQELSMVEMMGVLFAIIQQDDVKAYLDLLKKFKLTKMDYTG